jgi:hypothetical protein
LARYFIRVDDLSRGTTIGATHVDFEADQKRRDGDMESL